MALLLLHFRQHLYSREMCHAVNIDVDASRIVDHGAAEGRAGCRGGQ
jgi:hypothetical protein